MAREELLSVNLARGLEKLPTPGLSFLMTIIYVVRYTIFFMFYNVFLIPSINIFKPFIYGTKV